MVEQSEWKWYGTAGHFVGSDSCRFHLQTTVGKYLISTVGEYFPLGREDRQEIGYERFYETMVFHDWELCKAEGCDCGSPALISASEIEMRGYNSRRDANEGHLEMCQKYSKP